MLRKLFFLFFIPAAAIAQEKLSLQDAVSIALKSNYSVLIAKNDAAAAVNDNTAGHAGMLPVISATGSVSQTENNLVQHYTDGRVVDKSNVGTTASGAGIALNWTLFDGLKMFVSKEKYGEMKALGEISFRIELENTIQQVITSYFDVVRQQTLLAATGILIGIDSERVALAQARLDVGSGSRLDLLQAKIDLNEQLSMKMKQYAAMEESKDRLNYLLSRKPGTLFSPSDSMVITYHPSEDQLRNSAIQNNQAILAAQRAERISLLGMKEMKSQRAPVIGFSGGYNFGKTKSEAGFLLLNQSQGINYGLSVRWNLFDGFNVSRQVKNASLDYESSQLHLEDLKLSVSTQVENALRNFSNNLKILTLETENILLARENLDVAFERFRTGLSTSLELKNAQYSFQNAEARLVQAQYDAKMSETELMRLNGELVK